MIKSDLHCFLSCKQFVPTGSKWKDAKAKTTFGRKSAISIVASFNQTDWVSGWNHFIQGCTIFINPEFEKTLDPDDSVILSPGTLPILSVEQIKTKKLGSPYSKCTERNRIASSLSSQFFVAYRLYLKLKTRRSRVYHLAHLVSIYFDTLIDL